MCHSRTRRVVFLEPTVLYGWDADAKARHFRLREISHVAPVQAMITFRLERTEPLVIA